MPDSKQYLLEAHENKNRKNNGAIFLQKENIS
jgi:hypothetical protein